MNKDDKSPKINRGGRMFREVKITEPIETITKKGWVDWGKDNLYPQYLNMLYQKSPIHGGIVNSKVKFVAGGGITIDNDLDGSILRNGRSKFTLEEVYKRLALDFELYNSFAVLCKKDLLKDEWYFDYISRDKLRSSQDEDVYYFSHDWSAKRQDQNSGFREYKSFFNRDQNDVECILICGNEPKQVLLDNGKLTLGYYPLPTYNGAIDSIHTDIEINFYRRSEVINGYKGGTMISLNNGVPDSQEEADKVIKSIKEEATDKKKQGGLIVMFSDGSENAPTVEQLNGNDLDKRYESTETGLMQKILIAHSVVNPKMFGILQNNALSEVDLLNDFKLFDKTYGQDRRKELIECLEFLLLELKDYRGAITANDFKLIEEPQQKQPEQMAKQSDEERILSEFEKCGRSKDGVKFIASCEFKGETEEEFTSRWKVEKFAPITDIKKDILKLIAGGAAYQDIINETGLTPEKVTANILGLENDGLLEDNELTTEGKAQIVDEAQIEVVYSYEVRPDAPPLKKGGQSRDFCQTLIQRDRIYSRSEIDQITSSEGRDVWLYRGGWLHDTRTGKNQPSCRHYWQQHIIVK